MLPVLNNLQIKTKIITFLGIVIVLTIGFDLLTIERIASLGSVTTESRDRWLPVTRALWDYSFHTMRFRQIEAGVLYAEVSEHAAWEEARLQIAAAELQQAWIAFEAAAAILDFRAMDDQIKIGWRNYLSLDQKMLVAIHRGAKDEAYAMYVGKMDNSYNEWNALLLKCIDLQLQAADRIPVHDQRLYDSTRLWICGTLTLATTLCSLIGCRIVAGISRPMLRVTELIRRLACNDLTVRIEDVDRKDEFGNIMRALSMIKVKLIKATKLQAEQSAIDEIAKSTFKAVEPHGSVANNGIQDITILDSTENKSDQNAEKSWQGADLACRVESTASANIHGLSSAAHAVLTRTAGAERRMYPRKNVDMPCWVDLLGRGVIGARIFDISEGGAKLVGLLPELTPGTRGKLRVDDLTISLSFTVLGTAGVTTRLSFEAGELESGASRWLVAHIGSTTEMNRING